MPRDGVRTAALALPIDVGAFERHARLTCFVIRANEHTRCGYWGDFLTWFAFYRRCGFDPADPPEGAAEAFVEHLTLCKEAPKTRLRRMSALSSIYKRLCRPRGNDQPPVAKHNPFSPELGPDREPALPIEPTPMADRELVRRILTTCGDSEPGIRDEAIIRILWGTGMRRLSLFSMSFAGLLREGDNFVATVIGKRGKEQRVLIKGKAAAALERWMAILREAGFSTGPIWRSKRGLMTPRQLGRMLDERVQTVGAKAGALIPHGFRVAFLAINPAGLEAKQDAAGHADPKTTSLYGRSTWKGREAFEVLPEVEDEALANGPGDQLENEDVDGEGAK